MALSETHLGSEDEIEVEGLPPGTMFGAFLIQRPLGRGGMGAVYEALDPRLQRSVALKVLPAEFLHDPTFARRFETEARLAARLEHPNIVPIYASGIEDGIPWMSMRLLAGKNLSALLQDRRLAAPEAVALLQQVAAALDHAHALGVVHRDIKPANILLDRHGVASVADFGLAQLMDSGVRLTRTGMLSGTPHYMAPEQALGQRVDQRCDIYALGIVAYEMLVGRTPFKGDSPVAVLLQQVHQQLPAPANQGVPAEWMKAIHKATAKNPAERWPSAGAFVEALAASIVTAPAGVEAPASRPSRSMSVRTGVLAAVAVLVIAGLVWVAVPSSDDAPAPAAVAAVADKRPEQQEGPIPPPDPTSPPTRVSEDSRPRSPTPPSGAESKQNPRSKQEPAPPAPLEPPPDKESPRPATPSPSPVVVVEGIRGLESLPGPPGVVPPAPPKDEVTAPELIRRVTPEYPAAATRAKIEGEVTLRGSVDVRGNVTDIEVLRSSHEVFKQPAVAAFKRFLYNPGRRNGELTPLPVTVTLEFTLGKN